MDGCNISLRACFGIAMFDHSCRLKVFGSRCGVCSTMTLHFRHVGVLINCCQEDFVFDVRLTNSFRDSRLAMAICQDSQAEMFCHRHWRRPKHRVIATSALKLSGRLVCHGEDGWKRSRAAKLACGSHPWSSFSISVDASSLLWVPVLKCERLGSPPTQAQIHPVLSAAKKVVVGCIMWQVIQ